MSDLISATASPTLPKVEARLNSAAQLEEIQKFREAAKEKKAFQDFEQMFVHLMLKEMRKTVNDSSGSTKSHATKMYEEMMDEAMAEQMARSGQLGLGRQLQESLRAERLQREIRATEKIMMNEALETIKV